MNSIPPRIPVILLLWIGLAACTDLAGPGPRSVDPESRSGTTRGAAMERIRVSADGRGFELVESGRPFVPWGMNYGNDGRLIEDFWETEWPTIAEDFREMKDLGANVVRVHLQFGKFMDAPDQPNEAALCNLERLMRLSEDTGLYLDLTGLACYRPADVPEWYNSLDEPARWAAQARFWEAIAARCASSPAVFCYDLMNEPIVPGEAREAGAWYSGSLFGGYDFVQFIALDPAGRERVAIAREWIRQLSEPLHRQDPDRLITVGLLPSTPEWGHLSGFVPSKVAPVLDFVSVHVYPETGQVEQALDVVNQFAVGKPVVIEETFPLRCSDGELEAFLLESRSSAAGWLGHFDGRTPEDYAKKEAAEGLTIAEAMWRNWLVLFQRLGARMTHMSVDPIGARDIPAVSG